MSTKKGNTKSKKSSKSKSHKKKKSSKHKSKQKKNKIQKSFLVDLILDEIDTQKKPKEEKGAKEGKISPPKPKPYLSQRPKKEKKEKKEKEKKDKEKNEKEKKKKEKERKEKDKEEKEKKEKKKKEKEEKERLEKERKEKEKKEKEEKENKEKKKQKEEKERRDKERKEKKEKKEKEEKKRKEKEEKEEKERKQKLLKKEKEKKEKKEREQLEKEKKEKLEKEKEEKEKKEKEEKERKKKLLKKEKEKKEKEEKEKQEKLEKKRKEKEEKEEKDRLEKEKKEKKEKKKKEKEKKKQKSKLSKMNEIKTEITNEGSKEKQKTKSNLSTNNKTDKKKEKEIKKKNETGKKIENEIKKEEEKDLEEKEQVESESENGDSSEDNLIESGSEKSDPNHIIFPFDGLKNFKTEFEVKKPIKKNANINQNSEQVKVRPIKNTLTHTLSSKLIAKQEEEIILSSSSDFESEDDKEQEQEKKKKKKKKKKNKKKKKKKKKKRKNSKKPKSNLSNENLKETDIIIDNAVVVEETTETKEETKEEKATTTTTTISKEFELNKSKDSQETLKLRRLMDIAIKKFEVSSEIKKFIDIDLIRMKIESGQPIDLETTKKVKKLRRKRLIPNGTEGGVTDILTMSTRILEGEGIGAKDWGNWEEYDTSDEEMEGYDYEYDGDLSKGQSKKLKEGIFQFNKSIKKGMKYCIEKGIVGGDYRSIARFLYETEGLGKTQVGEYLGLGNEFSNKVLLNFAACFDFTGMHIDEALREYIGTFRIPGEAQKIDRIMESFAKHYCKNNPNVFTTSDTAYVLAFSMIMLNTDAHNDGVKNKMSKTQFFANCRGIDDGNDIPQEFLGNIYDRIVNNEIKLKNSGGQEETITFINPEKKGWLTKQGGRIKTWKTRWFLLSYNCLYYFKTLEDNEPCGIIPLDDVKVDRIKAKGKKHKYVFEITSVSKDEFTKGAKFANSGQLVTGHHKSYIISTATEDEMDEWIQEINNNIAGSQLGKIIDQKKNKLNKKKN
ncbi:cytohesin-4 [Anaeramoeba flamelloides]|uniref:Cytohesin-4 n=1 Tax=Anaeramoeba flamelloides TaxID=1746091 RepID=A0AAV7YQ82_9EUKA|nr:cytohesin-4 [Anaeramoeba flamelloides]